VGLSCCHRLGSVVLVVEAPFALGIVGYEGMVALASDNAGIHEVVDEHGCALILLYLPPGLGKLGLDFLKLGQLGPDLILLLERLHVGLSDFGLGSSSLRAGLQHVHASAMQHYR